MDTESALVGLLFVWLVIGAALLRDAWQGRRAGVGLLLAYFFSMMIIHWFGALIYALPWFDGPEPTQVAVGFGQSTLGLLAFVLGALWLGPYLVNALPAVFPEAPGFLPHRLTPIVYSLTGVFFFIVMAPVLSDVPSIRTFIWGGWSLLLAGICLGSWQAWLKRAHLTLFGWALVSLTPAAFMLVREGFLSFGIAALTVVITFMVRFFRPRWLTLVVGSLGIYLGLSLFVTYLRDREEMRALMWFQEGGEFRSASFFAGMLTDFEWFDPRYDDHLVRINLRLNQNQLVGAAVAYLDAGTTEFARGETFGYALEALIPRLLWPEKTVTAGSMGLVSRFTGITYPDDTVVGIGQVLEFYVNFGTPSVVLGFLLLGILIRFVDEAAGNRLRRGDWRGFVGWFVPSLALLQAGGSLVDMLGGAAAGVVFTVLLRLLMPPLQMEEAPPDRALHAGGPGSAGP